MKNKWFTYFLGLLVLVVWGMIFHKIINPDDYINTTDFTPGSSSTKELLNDYSAPDTLQLALNYPDPFRMLGDDPKSASKEHIRQNTRFSARKQVLQKRTIIYSGYVRRSGSSKFLSILSVDGKDAILHEGETFDEVKLLKNYVDSIKILSYGKTSYIKLQ